MDGLEVATLLYGKGLIARGDRVKVIEAIDNAAISDAFEDRDEDVAEEAAIEAAEDLNELHIMSSLDEDDTSLDGVNVKG